MNNPIVAILGILLVLFCAVVAINTTLGILVGTLGLVGWVMDNLSWLWFPAAIALVLFIDYSEKK
jgi:hypothetical protein